MKNRRFPLLFLKGVAMGAADVVPGVSGGTIAFVTGIYEELLHAIKSVDGRALRMLLTGHFRAFWQKINGNFLFVLVAGIAVSIFSLARLMTWLLVHHPIPVWSFFFGLIVASAWLVARDVSRWNASAIAGGLVGAVAAYLITAVSPASTPDTRWFILLSGAIAICAMILPGISGSFILLLLGKYQFLMTAVGELNIGVILLFVTGAVAGIISFSHLLSWLLKHFRNVTIAVLTGFMVGSLNKIWPWKETVETYLDSHGVEHPLREVNLLPGAFAEATGADPQLAQALIFCLIGLLLIVAIESLGKALKRKSKGDAPEFLE
jgi:putative membrane protein